MEKFCNWFIASPGVTLAHVFVGTFDIAFGASVGSAQLVWTGIGLWVLVPLRLWFQKGGAE